MRNLRQVLNTGPYSILLLLMKNEPEPLLRIDNILRFNLLPGGARWPKTLLPNQRIYIPGSIGNYSLS